MTLEFGNGLMGGVGCEVGVSGFDLFKTSENG